VCSITSICGSLLLVLILSGAQKMIFGEVDLPDDQRAHFTHQARLSPYSVYSVESLLTISEHYSHE